MNLAAKDSGLECTCVNNGDFTVLVSGGGRRRLVSMCSACHCIQNDWVSRATYLHLILWYTWMLLCGNYLDDSEGCSYRQLVMGSFIMTMRLLMHHVSCRVFWWNMQSARWLSPLQPRFGALQLLAFPKALITFEREEVSDC